MLERISIYFSIFISSAVKFIAGPTIGMATDLTVGETALFTALGMMFSVIGLTFFGRYIRFLFALIWSKKRRVFSKRNRRLVYIWQQYGIQGTAFLTPLFLTPIGGAILANSFKSPRMKILKYMGISAVLWAVALSWGVKHLREFLILWV
ncbi:MAG: hypothetical protein O2887_10860 [Bacteroidetes bacterium]|nr:hypothetical protein [Bacteroidota bacterium]MDA1120971.1 hypothetical protein [Bacteroidota bacterium]